MSQAPRHSNLYGFQYAWRSIKYDEIYLKAYDSVRAARCRIAKYLQYYNSAWPYQAHNQAWSDEVYFAALPLVKRQKT